jgi:hypothetical protein
MSAELLRRAAAKMRERALDACSVFTATGEEVPWHTEASLADCWDEDEVPHIASWSPAVALAVANMLDAIAEAWPVSDPVYAKTSRAEALGHRQALVLARAYLGESA